MKNTLKVAIIVLILVVISVILFITGKRHDILKKIYHLMI